MWKQVVLVSLLFIDRLSFALFQPKYKDFLIVYQKPHPVLKQNILRYDYKDIEGAIILFACASKVKASYIQKLADCVDDATIKQIQITAVSTGNTRDILGTGHEKMANLVECFKKMSLVEGYRKHNKAQFYQCLLKNDVNGSFKKMINEDLTPNEKESFENFEACLAKSKDYNLEPIARDCLDNNPVMLDFFENNSYLKVYIILNKTGKSLKSASDAYDNVAKFSGSSYNTAKDFAEKTYEKAKDSAINVYDSAKDFFGGKRMKNNYQRNKNNYVLELTAKINF